jgi:drug/metabolite transporter (DMT)-like permease
LPTEAAEQQSRVSPAAPPVHHWRGYFLIAAATFCWGAAATVGKAAFNGSLFARGTQISPLVLSQGRTTFAVLVLGAFLLLRFGREFFRFSKRDLLLAACVGVLGLAGSNYFYYLAIQKGTVALAITLQYTAPVWVLLTMVARGKERFTLRALFAIALGIFGIALTIDLLHAHASFRAVAVVAAMIASFSFAFYNIMGQELVSRSHHLKIMFYVLLASATLWMIVNPPWKLVASHYSGAQWGFLFGFACISTLLPYVFYFSGLKYLDPTRAVIASCLEPVFAIFFAMIFLGEGMRAIQALGILLVLASTVMVQIGGRAPAPID